MHPDRFSYFLHPNCNEYHRQLAILQGEVCQLVRYKSDLWIRKNALELMARIEGVLVDPRLSEKEVISFFERCFLIKNILVSGTQLDAIAQHRDKNGERLYQEANRVRADVIDFYKGAWKNSIGSLRTIAVWADARVAEFHARI